MCPAVPARTVRFFRSGVGAAVLFFLLVFRSTAARGRSEFPAAVKRVIGPEALGLEFRSPESFTFDPSRDEFLVADTQNRRIVIFTAVGDAPSVLDLRKSGVSPLSIALGSAGRLYVTDQERGDLVFLDFRGAVEGRMSGADLGLEKPVMCGALHLDEVGVLWAVDRLSGDIIRVSAEENRAVRLVPEHPDQGYRKIADIHREPGGTLWLLSSFGAAVRGFRPDMTPVAGFATHGPRNDQVSFPAGFCLDQRGRFWIVDKFRHRVAIYSKDGGFLGSLGKGGTGTGEFRYPTDCLFLTDDEFAVLDGGNSRVQIFSLHE